MTRDGPSNNWGGGGWLGWLKDNIDVYDEMLASALLLGAEIIVIDVSAVPMGVRPGLWGYLDTALHVQARQDNRLLFFFPFNLEDRDNMCWYIVWKED